MVFVLKLSSCTVKYFSQYESTKLRSYYTVEKPNKKLPIFLFPHMMDEIVEFMESKFNDDYKEMCKLISAIYYCNNFYFPNPKPQLRGEIHLGHKINKRNELIVTLQCLSKSRKKCRMAISLTKTDYRLLKVWLDRTIEEWKSFSAKIKSLQLRDNWPNDEWMVL